RHSPEGVEANPGRTFRAGDSAAKDRPRGGFRTPGPGAQDATHGRYEDKLHARVCTSPAAAPATCPVGAAVLLHPTGPVRSRGGAASAALLNHSPTGRLSQNRSSCSSVGGAALRT